MTRKLQLKVRQQRTMSRSFFGCLREVWILRDHITGQSIDEGDGDAAPLHVDDVLPSHGGARTMRSVFNSRQKIAT